MTDEHHPIRCDLIKELYAYAVAQFTSAEGDSDIEKAFEKMLDLFPQTIFARTGIWPETCVSSNDTPAQHPPGSLDRKKMIDYLIDEIAHSQCHSPKCVCLNLKQKIEYGDFNIANSSPVQVLDELFPPNTVINSNGDLKGGWELDPKALHALEKQMQSDPRCTEEPVAKVIEAVVLAIKDAARRRSNK